MTLVVADPSPAPVIRHPTGLITVRLADYPGAARGTLSTTTDALAASGTTIVDEQELAAETTFVGFTPFFRWGLADDSAVIPVADLNREKKAFNEVDYDMFVSLRMTGALPSTAWYLHGWAAIDAFNSPQAGVGWGIGNPGTPSFKSSVRSLPTGLFPHYLLRSFDRGLFFPGDGDDTDEIVIRAWGVTGGTSAWRLETLYLVPRGGDFDFNEYSVLALNSGILDFFNNGVVWRDFDQDATDLPFGGGKYSVLPWDVAWGPDDPGWGQAADFQIGDLENTATDLNGGGQLSNDPKSRVIAVTGSSFIPGPEELMVDDFLFGQGTHVTYGAWYEANIGKERIRTLLLGANSHILDWWDFPTNSIRGTWVMPSTGYTINPAFFGPGTGEGVGTTFFGNSTGRSIVTWPGNPLPGGLMGWYGGYGWGLGDLEGGFSATLDPNDPSLRQKYFWPDGTETYVATCRTSVLDSAEDCGTTLGTEAFSSGGYGMFANLFFDGGGAVELSLYYNNAPFGSKLPGTDYSLVDGPVTIAGSWSLGDWFWIKVEKRGYFWRARAWADGATEPSTWDVEGFQPGQGAGGTGYYQYPYDVTWAAGGASADSWQADPRGGPGGRSLSAHGWLASFQYAGRQQLKQRILIADMSAYYVPESADPTDTHIRMEKYDGTVDYGSATIPWGAHRMVEASLAHYNFNADDNGFNVSLWKEAGAPDWQTSGASRFYQRAPFGSFLPHIYRLVVF